MVVAGTGTAGAESNQLNSPWKIFIDFRSNLYVADSKNHRIQRFQPGNRNGTTLAGNGIPAGLTLAFPVDCLLDPSGFLYVVDTWNHRIVRVKENRWRCIAACDGGSGRGANQFDGPIAVQMDRYGNLYVSDEANDRIQKFELIKHGCGK